MILRYSCIYNVMLMCVFSWASMGTPTWSPTTATSCPILTCDLWYSEKNSISERTIVKLQGSSFLQQYKEGKKLKPKPNYNSVDLSEVEWEDTEEKVSMKF